jgi:hypothetical protein
MMARNNTFRIASIRTQTGATTMSALKMIQSKINRRSVLRGAIVAVPMVAIPAMAGAAVENGPSMKSDFGYPSKAPGWKGNGIYELARFERPEFFWIDRYICRNEDNGEVTSIYRVSLLWDGYKIAPCDFLADGGLQIIRKVEDTAECERLFNSRKRQALARFAGEA